MHTFPMTRYTRASVGSVSVALVWPFIAWIKAASEQDASAFVRAQLGLDENQFADPSTRVPITQLAELLDTALQRSGQRDIGLLAARRVEAVHLGLMEDVTRSKGTLRSALEAGIRYVPLIGDCVHYSFEVSGDRATTCFWFDPGIQIHEAAVEFTVAVGVSWARRLIGNADVAPLEVHFMHRAPPDVTRHQKTFRCPLFFNAPVTKVVMPARALEHQLKGSEPVLAQLLQQRAEGLLQSLPRAHGIATQVRKVLASQRELRSVTAAQVAKRLGLGTRTLARRLDAEQTSYREVLDEVRKQSALRSLTDTERSIADIADSLGFSSPQSFHRAFRRWTGTTAAEFRRRQLITG
ncbi:MAG: AraC family transcriptional regulator [Polyangiales bacterium]